MTGVGTSFPIIVCGGLQLHWIPGFGGPMYVLPHLSQEYL